MSRHVATPAGLLGTVGAHLGPTGPTQLTPRQWEMFERSTGAPTSGTLPELFLLSIVNLFLPDLITVDSFSMGVNVGLDRVRYPAPADPSTPLSAIGEVISAITIGEGVQVVVRVTIMSRGTAVCVADTVSRFFPEP